MSEHRDEATRDALAAFIAAGHKPMLDEKGEPDAWAYDTEWNGGHSGFICDVCADSICVLCFANDIRMGGAHPLGLGRIEKCKGHL